MISSYAISGNRRAIRVLFQWLTLPVFAVFIVLYLRRVRHRQMSPLAGVVLSSVWVAAILVVLRPDLTTSIAEKMGIGRGSDLVLYVSSMILFAFTFHLYLTTRRQNHEITLLTRRLAHLEADLEAQRSKQVSE
jgi:hypothetical protein